MNKTLFRYFNYINSIKYRIKIYLKFVQLSLSPNKRSDIVNQFHELYYDYVLQHTWKQTFFLGTIIEKCPLDLFIYQEILYELKPDIIIETGTAYGGSSIFLASICDLINYGQVITIDIKDYHKSPQHKRITYLVGSSTSKRIVNQVKKMIKNKNKILVILDSDHSKKNVLEELMIYSKFVTKESYIIVEDSNVIGHPVYSSYGPGPMEAIEEFMKRNINFAIDKTREKFLLTFNPDGYLKRIK